MTVRAKRKSAPRAFPASAPAPIGTRRTPGPGERVKRGHDASGWQYGRAPGEGDPRRLVYGGHTLEIVEVITGAGGRPVGYGIAGGALLWIEDRYRGGPFWIVLP